MVKAFLIYSYDTKTSSYDLNGKEVNMCQILGRGYGSTPDEAILNFIENNSWINEVFFENIIVIEINEHNCLYTTISQAIPLDIIGE